MRKFALAVAAIALTSGSALASSTNGVVSSYNPQVRVITLQNGQSYTVPRSVPVPAIRAGQNVTITFRDDGDDVTNVLTGSLWHRR